MRASLLVIDSFDWGEKTIEGSHMHARQGFCLCLDHQLSLPLTQTCTLRPLTLDLYPNREIEDNGFATATHENTSLAKHRHPSPRSVSPSLPPSPSLSVALRLCLSEDMLACTSPRSHLSLHSLLLLHTHLSRALFPCIPPCPS